MPVSLFLNEGQVDVLNRAFKGKKTAPTVTGRTVTVTRDNVVPIREAVHALHQKKFSVRTKTVEHLETCYYAKQILDRLDAIAAEFEIPPVNETNDNTVGIVEVAEEEVETFPFVEYNDTTEPESDDNNDNNE